MATKILVTGDVRGSFDALFTRVGKVHASKAGPFHALLCVGAFFGRKGAAELADYVSGAKQVPLPTYFVAGDEFDAKLIDSLPQGGQVCPNLHYLGRSGVAALDLGGKRLNVAFLSGIYDQSSYFNTASEARHAHFQPHYIEADVVSVLSAGLRSEVDILLTAEWGRGWQALTPAEKVPEGLRAGATAQGSPVVAKLASQLSARYHFAGTQDTYFELAPYRNRIFVTRFFGMGAVDSPKKEKSLYACNVAPFAAIDKSVIPAEATACPYTLGKPQPGAATSSMAAVAAAPAPSHPFPSDGEHNKRQKLESGFTDPRAASAADVASGDAVGLANHRWNFTKPERGPPPASYVCRICQEPGHWIEQCPQRTHRADDRDREPPPADYVCRKCNLPGHFIRLCPLILAEGNAPRTERTTPGALPAGYLCKVCQQPGHRITECEVVKRENAERDALRAARRGAPGAGPAGGRLDANGMPLGTDAACWFCLASEHVSTHLILSVGNENYLAQAKGALNDEHVLILPIVHVATTLELTPEQATEMDRYKLALRRYYRSKGLECVMYERYIPTRAAQHMHIQVVPMTRDQARTAKAQIHEQGRVLSEHLTFQEIPRANTLLQANPGRQPFVLFELPAFDEAAAPSASASSASANDFPTERLIHYVQQQRERKVQGLFDFPRAACATLIGQPDRSDWKRCTTNEADETELVEKMKTTFAPFDFTLAEEEAAPADAQPMATA